MCVSCLLSASEAPASRAWRRGTSTPGICKGCSEGVFRALPLCPPLCRRASVGRRCMPGLQALAPALPPCARKVESVVAFGIVRLSTARPAPVAITPFAITPHCPCCCLSRPTSATQCQSSANVGNIWPNIGQSRKTMAALGQVLAHLGQTRPNLGLPRPNLGRLWPKFGQHRRALDQHRLEFGRHCPEARLPEEQFGNFGARRSHQGQRSVAPCGQLIGNIGVALHLCGHLWGDREVGGGGERMGVGDDG